MFSFYFCIVLSYSLIICFYVVIFPFYLVLFFYYSFLLVFVSFYLFHGVVLWQANKCFFPLYYIRIIYQNGYWSYHFIIRSYNLYKIFFDKFYAQQWDVYGLTMTITYGWYEFQSEFFINIFYLYTFCNQVQLLDDLF